MSRGPDEVDIAVAWACVLFFVTPLIGVTVLKDQEGPAVGALIGGWFIFCLWQIFRDRSES